MKSIIRPLANLFAILFVLSLISSSVLASKPGSQVGADQKQLRAGSGDEKDGEQNKDQNKKLNGEPNEEAIRDRDRDRDRDGECAQDSGPIRDKQRAQSCVSKSELEGETLEISCGNLEVELPIFDTIYTVTADVTLYIEEWTGKGKEVLTPSGRLNYHVKFENAQVTITLENMVVDPPIAALPESITVLIDAESGMINGHSVVIENTINVLLKAKSVEINDVPIIGSVELGAITVKINDSKLLFVNFEEPEVSPAPRRVKVQTTTLGKIKSR